MKNLYTRLNNIVSKNKILDWVALGLGLAVFGLVTICNITKSSIWFDEAFSSYIVRFDFLEIARYTSTDVHPPFYYWVLRLWVEFFGNSELALRSLSMLFGMTAIIFGFMLVRRLFGRRAAWISLLFLAVSPMLVRYSQEARMYTLAATIALAATYTLSIAVDSKKRTPWILYGVLVGLGMWTHYFTALVWLGHWVWRFIVTERSGVRKAGLIKAYFTKNWIIAYSIAVGMFLPWVPFVYNQFTSIQSNGFWIGPVSANTLTNYLTNIFYYLESNQTLGWWALVFVLAVAALGYVSIRLYRSMNKLDRQKYLLIIAIAFIPVVILFLVSLPPLKSSFVERYLIPSTVGFALFAGVTLALSKVRVVWRAALAVLIVGCMVFGVSNVYHYGNYNKNSNTQINTRQVIEEIREKAQSGEPIIADSAWVFYEAIVYDTAEHPVYFIDENMEYVYSSMDMLHYNDEHKIKDLAEFTQKNPVVWYMGNVGNGSIKPPVADWQELQKISIYSQLDKTESYKAVQFRTF